MSHAVSARNQAMFSNEARSIRAALGGFTSPLSEEDRQLVTQARANLEALAVQLDEWEGSKPRPGVSIGRIEIKGVPEDIAASFANAIKQSLGSVGGV